MKTCFRLILPGWSSNILRPWACLHWQYLTLFLAVRITTCWDSIQLATFGESSQRAKQIVACFEEGIVSFFCFSSKRPLQILLWDSLGGFYFPLGCSQTTTSYFPAANACTHICQSRRSRNVPHLFCGWGGLFLFLWCPLALVRPRLWPFPVRAATLIHKTSLADHAGEPSQSLSHFLHIFTSFPWALSPRIEMEGGHINSWRWVNLSVRFISLSVPGSFIALWSSHWFLATSLAAILHAHWSSNRCCKGQHLLRQRIVHTHHQTPMWRIYSLLLIYARFTQIEERVDGSRISHLTCSSIMGA